MFTAKQDILSVRNSVHHLDGGELVEVDLLVVRRIRISRQIFGHHVQVSVSGLLLQVRLELTVHVIR